MADEVLVVSCRVADFDATTGTCSAPFYSAPQSAFPTMSIDDAQQIGMAVALLWAGAWSIKQCKRALMRIG